MRYFRSLKSVRLPLDVRWSSSLVKLLNRSPSEPAYLIAMIATPCATHVDRDTTVIRVVAERWCKSATHFQVKPLHHRIGHYLIILLVLGPSLPNMR